MKTKNKIADKYDNSNAHLWTNTDHPFSNCVKRNKFKSPYDEESKHNGREFKIIGLSSLKNFDMHEVGPYYRIQFTDGKKEIIDADPIEIYKNIGTVGNKKW